MSDITAQVMDQRCGERIAIGESVEFRCKADEDFRKATMVDFSETGMLIYIDEQHPADATFEVRVKEQECISFQVQSVRITQCNEAGMYGYGCRITDHTINS